MGVVDSLFRNANVKMRREYVDMTETVKEMGCTVHIFSSQHVSGEQLAQLSGIAGILRFPLPELDDIDSDAGLDDDEQDANDYGNIGADAGADEDDEEDEDDEGGG